MPSRQRPSVYYFRKHVPEGDRPVGNFTVSRRVNTEVGFLGSHAVKDVLARRDKTDSLPLPDVGFPIITRERAQRLAATYPGTQGQLDRALDTAIQKLPTKRTTSIRRIETVSPDNDISEYAVAVVLNQSVRAMRRYERHFIYAGLETPWMVAQDRAGPLSIPIFTTRSSMEAERTASMLSDIVALGNTALVLGELYVSKTAT